MALLVYADTDGVEHSFTVGAEPITVGRSTECAIRSSDPRVSRNHARFFLDHAGQLHVEDLGSSNGVFVGPHKVAHSPVPMDAIVLIGSLAFRLVAPAAMPAPQGFQNVEWAQPATQPAAHQYQQPEGHAAQPQAYAAPPPSSPSVDVGALVEDERKARLAAEEERDAYGARMAELHGELRALKQTLEATQGELARARVPVGDGEMQQRIAALLAERDQLAGDLDAARVRASEVEDQLKSAETRLRSVEEELSVARADVTAAEERIVAEIAAHEQRSSAELASRVEELEVTRADLIKAEERIVELTRKVGDLETQLGRF